MENRIKPAKPKRVKWNERTPENDIKFSGPLSYRGLRILAWVTMVLAQVTMILELNIKIDPSSEAALTPWLSFFSFFIGFPIPLFLLANFSQMFHEKGNFSKLLIKYGALALGMYVFANLLIFHYGFGLVNAFTKNLYNFQQLAYLLGGILSSIGKNAYCLNIFIDMTLVTLIYLFLFYQPKSKAFEGKKILLFRALFLLPVLYEVGMVVLKYFITTTDFVVPSYVFFLIPSKPPFILLAFLIIFFSIKFGMKRFLKKGYGETEYIAHTTTKAHALKMSVIIAIIFFTCAVIDIIFSTIAVFTMVIPQASTPDITEELLSLLVLEDIRELTVVGLFGAQSLFLIAPIVLLFSYTKSYPKDKKNRIIDLAIPVVGLALVFFLYIEGIFQVIVINVPHLIEKIESFFSGGEEEVSVDPSSSEMEEGSELISGLFNPIRSAIDYIRCLPYR